MRNWIAAITLAMCSAAFAGPDATANRFLNDTPSMMDWGMYQVQQMLSADPAHGAEVTVTYNWEDNQVLIRRFRQVDAGSDVAHLQDECRIWFEKTRSSGWVVAATGEVIALFPASRYAGMFRHNGFSRTLSGVSEEDAIAALDKMFYLSFGTYDYAGKPLMQCEGPLLDTGFSVKQN